MRIGWIAMVVGTAFVGCCAAAELPRTSDGKPDLNGSWNLPYTPNMAKGIGELPFSAEGKAAYAKVSTKYDPTGFCMFPGVPRINNSPFPMRIVEAPESVVFLYEYMTTFRAVPLGTLEHSKNPEPTFMGESIGQWDGDALVIDTWDSTIAPGWTRPGIRTVTSCT